MSIEVYLPFMAINIRLVMMETNANMLIARGLPDNTLYSNEVHTNSNYSMFVFN